MEIFTALLLKENNMKTETTINKKTKSDSKVKVDPKLDKIKDIKIKSDKLDEINKYNFKLNF